MYSLLTEFERFLQFSRKNRVLIQALWQVIRRMCKTNKQEQSQDEALKCRVLHP